MTKLFIKNMVHFDNFVHELDALHKASCYTYKDTVSRGGELCEVYFQKNCRIVTKENGEARNYYPIGAIEISEISLDGIEVIDQRVTAPFVFPEMKNIELRAHQKQAADLVPKHTYGVLVMPTGAGKTIAALEIARKLGQKTLIVCHRKNLANQWIKEIESIFGIKCGFIGDQQWDVQDVTVALIGTLYSRKEDLFSLFDNFGTVFFDECHHVGAETFNEVATRITCKYRYGLTATPERRDEGEGALYLYFGLLMFETSMKEMIKSGACVPVHVMAINTEEKVPNFRDRHEYIDWCVSCRSRNELIIRNYRTGCPPSATLILTERKEHVEELSKIATEMGIVHTAIHGSMPKKEQKAALENPGNLTIATSSLLGEGINVQGWRALYLATPMSSEGRLIQAIGRICRKSEGKNTAVVADFVDKCGFSKASFNKRLEIYRREEIKVIFV